MQWSCTRTRVVDPDHHAGEELSSYESHVDYRSIALKRDSAYRASRIGSQISGFIKVGVIVWSDQLAMCRKPSDRKDRLAILEDVFESGVVQTHR